MVLQKFGYDLEGVNLTNTMGNKLLCTFATGDTVESVVESVQNTYSTLFNEIFILHAKDQGEYLVTYNVEFGNVSMFLENTILVHRKKESRTLYTINALNTLIRELNQGRLDINYQINWYDYQNCVLLTKGLELKKIQTVLHDIVEIQ